MERVADTPEWAAGLTGIPAATIRRLAHELGVTARDQRIEPPIPWTDLLITSTPRSAATRWPFTPCAAWRRTQRLPDHPRPGHPQGRSSAPSTVPGAFAIAPPSRGRSRPVLPPKGPGYVQPDTPLDGSALGWPAKPDDLFVDDREPLRIDKAFSWEHRRCTA